MARWRRNTIANYVGTAWTGVARLAAIPLYIKFFGIEAFGLIAFYMSLQAILSGADFGLAPTLSRVLAKWTAEPGKIQSPRRVFASLERLGIGAAALLFIAVMLCARYLAFDWLRLVHFSPITAEYAIMLMGAVGACRWMTNLYRGGLFGLQRQILLNALQSGFATLRWFGALVPLLLMPFGLVGFFWLQLTVAIIELMTYRVLLLRYVPGRSDGAWTSAFALGGNGRFAGAMSALSVFGLILGQMDKIVLSRVLPLTQFAYYSLATSIATVFVAIASPILNSSYPHLTELVARREQESLIRSYHHATQLVALLLIPAAITFCYVSPMVISLWTGSGAIATQIDGIAALLVLASAVHGMAYMPYALEMANGWVSPSLAHGIASVTASIPIMLLLVPKYGPIVAALNWLSVNLALLLIIVPIIHSPRCGGSAH